MMFNPTDTRAPYRRQEWAMRPDLKLDANEGPCPALGYGGLTLGSEAVRCYPQVDSVEKMLAARYGVEANRVLITAGIDDAIDRLSRFLLGGGGELILPSPTFEMFTRHAERAGGCVRPVEWTSGAFPVDAVAAAVTDRTAAIAVVSPNNPTGAVISRSELERLRAAVPGVPLILDLAYVEFADEDPTEWALDTPDVIILRTFSKAWGMAGARFGYVLADEATTASLRAWGQPYAVAGPSLALAASALDGGNGRLEMTVARVRQERNELAALLAGLGVQSLKSQANFILTRLPDAGFVGEALASLGIAVRTWPGDEALGNYLRIACPGDATDFARLSAALQTVLAPEALLLDMDGVIADEGPSYREAVLATLASYDVNLQRSDLAAAKAAAGANDDIDLTRDLLLQAGRTVAADDVVERFQRSYLGDGKTPGLCEQERLIPERSVLERLAAGRPLAIVTGRPRAEAQAFLRRFDLEDLFTTLVAAEDAPSKPDPAPVRVALNRLGVSRAWMVGDTPADITAARLAGVMAIGVRPPDAADAPGDRAMLGAGAVRMLDTLSGIERILP